MEKNNPKTINAWCMYDWANSVYALTITTAVFPAYYMGVTTQKDTEGNVLNNMVSFFGLELENSVLYSYALSIAFLVVAIISPFLSGLADYTGNKKRFMQFFAYLGSFSCAMLYFFEADTIQSSMIWFVLAGIGFTGSIVFYNAFLPEIATEDRYDKVSAKGFTMGYIGSVILLLFNLAMIQMPEFFGVDPENATLAPRISFLTVGIWWFLFAQIPFYYLPNNVHNRKPANKNIIRSGYDELKKVFLEVKQLPLLRKYLLAFFFYSMGVQTVMYLATIFGEEVVGLKLDELIYMVLLLQILAIAGAFLFALISKYKGNIFSIIITLIIWVLVCVIAYFIGYGDKLAFFGVAILVGTVMGGIQSMSRSTYSKMIPQDTKDNASYFSFYDVVEKVAIVLGTYVFGAVRQFTGNMNNSALALTIFFIIGLVILIQIPSRNVYNIKINR